MAHLPDALVERLLSDDSFQPGGRPSHFRAVVPDSVADVRLPPSTIDHPGPAAGWVFKETAAERQRGPSDISGEYAYMIFMMMKRLNKKRTKESVRCSDAPPSAFAPAPALDPAGYLDRLSALGGDLAKQRMYYYNRGPAARCW